MCKIRIIYKIQKIIMNSPIGTQPTLSDGTVTHIQSLSNLVPPNGLPIILGPIEASPPKPRVLGQHPSFTKCHMCNQEIKTVLCHRPTVKTHLFVLCLCIFGCWPCICLPYCMYTCTKTDHYCPYCSAFMGSHVVD